MSTSRTSYQESKATNWAKQVSQAPEWAKEVKSKRLEAGLRNGRSCFGKARAWVREPNGDEHWIDSVVFKAIGCPYAEHNPELHYYRDCDCPWKYVHVCSDNKIRCRCHDCEQRAVRDVERIAKEKKVEIIQIEFFTELEPCRRCREHFEHQVIHRGMQLQCSWLVRNNTDLWRFYNCLKKNK